jgi:hypothetical protein
MLREEGRPADALGLGVGHWRPRDQDVEVGRQLVLAAIEARRAGEARRTLDTLSAHPDTAAVSRVRAELEPLVEEAERNRAAGPPSGQIPVVDVRERKLFRRS